MIGASLSSSHLYRTAAFGWPTTAPAAVGSAGVPTTVSFTATPRRVDDEPAHEVGVGSGNVVPCFDCAAILDCSLYFCLVRLCVLFHLCRYSVGPGIIPGPSPAFFAFFFCSRSHSLYADGTFEPPSTCTATADPCFGMRNALIGSSSLKSAAVFRALSAELDVAVIICRRVLSLELGMFICCDVLRILARGFALAYSDKSSRSTDCHGQASVTPMPNESP